MTTAQALTILSGIAMLATAGVIALWQILSAPDRPNYPTSGPVKRAFMFWFMAALAYRGIEVITLAREVPPTTSTDGQVITSLLLFALFTTFLVDHVQHWLPARTHARIRQLLAIATCKPMPEVIEARTRAMKASTGAPCPSADVVPVALAELAMQGMAVVGPNEGPHAVTGADE